jgi:Protein of unknown function (DUF3375)
VPDPLTYDFAKFEELRTYHPAWRLLRAEHGALVVCFLHRVFVVSNARSIAVADLAESLEDDLYLLRTGSAEVTFRKTATDYLNEWASPERGWLRKFYRTGSDEPHFDLTPAAEKAIAWICTLSDRSFVGTESRLLTLFDLLKQISEGSEADPSKRIEELRRRRDEIDVEIARVQGGDVPILNDTAVKDRFQQFTQLARELLTDFREVEQKFRLLDRSARERIALWDGTKGTLVEEMIGGRDAIAESDQGRSFQAFWDFLLSRQRQEELSGLLTRVLALPAVSELKPDARTRLVHHDWLEAGGTTQRMVAQLSQQLRRFLDDQVWLENRRIMDILRNIETKALAIRCSPPDGVVSDIADMSCDVELPMERPLYHSTVKPVIADSFLELGDSDLNAEALYTQVVVDRARLIRHIDRSLQDQAEISLSELALTQPLKQGLAELVSYLHLGSGRYETKIDEAASEEIPWQVEASDGAINRKAAQLPLVVFER